MWDMSRRVKWMDDEEAANLEEGPIEENADA